MKINWKKPTAIQIIKSILIVFLVLPPILACAQKKIGLEVRSSLNPDPFSERVIKKYGLDNNQIPFNTVEQFCSRLLEEYENNGYPFARINLDSLKISGGNASALLIIQSGNLIRVDSIMNRTGYRLSGQIISRIIDVFPGDIYNETKIRGVARRLATVPFLKEIRPAEVGFHQNGASLFIYPEKVVANRFDGWIGLAPGGFGGSGITFAGSADLALNNLLGQAENWQLNWKRNQDRSQKMKLKTSFPYFLGLPIGIEGFIDLYRQDTSYLNVEWEAGLPYHFRPNHRLYVFVRSRESSLLTDQAVNDQFSRRAYKLWLTGLSWDLNTLDNRINPSRGLALRAEISTGKKDLAGSENSIRQTEFQSEALIILGLVRRFVIGSSIQTGFRNTPLSLENEQFRLGGLNRLRGFDEDSFHADAFCVSSLELRYLLDTYSHLLLFTDFAAFGKKLSSGWETAWPFSFGFGAQIRTGGGIFKILFALGSASEQRFDLRSGKIHLGYIGLF